MAPDCRNCARSRYGSGCGSPAARVHGTRIRRQRLQRHDPGRDRGREILRQERARAAGIPTPGCRAPTSRSAGTGRTRAARPRRSGRGSPSALPRADEDADFELVVEPPRRPERRLPRVRRLDLAARAAERRARYARSTTRGRDSRSAPTCSSAAAGCRAGTGARRWSRDGSTRRNRCSRRCAPAARYSALACGTRRARKRPRPARAVPQQARQRARAAPTRRRRRAP